MSAPPRSRPNTANGRTSFGAMIRREHLQQCSWLNLQWPFCRKHLRPWSYTDFLARCGYMKAAQVRRDNGTLTVRRAGRSPVVRHWLSSVDPVCQQFPSARTERRFADIRAHIFPNDFSRGGHLEEAPGHAFVYEGISIREAPNGTDKRGVERPCRLAGIGCTIFPDDLFCHRVDFEDARTAFGTKSKRNRRIACFALIVEEKQVARARQAFGNDLRIVLTADLIDRSRQFARARLLMRIVGAEPPHDPSRILINNSNEVCIPRADENIIGLKARIARIEPVVWADRLHIVEGEIIDSLGLADERQLLGRPTEFVEMLACDPSPSNLAFWRHLVDRLVHELGQGEPRQRMHQYR